jgi:hypothetical protein
LICIKGKARKQVFFGTGSVPQGPAVLSKLRLCFVPPIRFFGLIKPACRSRRPPNAIGIEPEPYPPSRSLRAPMPSAARSKTDKIEHPQSHYSTPDELIEYGALSLDEKTKRSRFGNRMRGKCLQPAARVCRAATRASIRAITICSDRSNVRGTSCKARENRRPEANSRRSICHCSRWS